MKVPYLANFLILRFFHFLRHSSCPIDIPYLAKILILVGREIHPQMVTFLHELPSVNFLTLRYFRVKSLPTMFPTLSHFSSFSWVKDKVGEKVIFICEQKSCGSINTQSFSIVGRTFPQKFFHEERAIFPHVSFNTQSFLLHAMKLFREGFVHQYVLFSPQ